MTPRSPDSDKRLSREALIAAALALIDDAGMEKLTARRLAHQLGASPMALYWHFRNKEELLDGVGDHLTCSIVVPDAPAGGTSWEEMLRGALNSVIDVAEQHPSASALIVKRLLFTERGRAVAETALSALRQAGLEDEAAVVVARHSLRVAVSVGAEALFTQPAESAQGTSQAVAFDAEAHPDLAGASPLLHQPSAPQAYRDTAVELLLGGVRGMAAGK